MDLAEMKVEVMRLVGGLHKEATEKSLGNTEALCTGVKLLVEALESENAALKARAEHAESKVTMYATGQCVCPANGDPSRNHYPGCPHAAALKIAALRAELAAQGPVLSEDEWDAVDCAGRMLAVQRYDPVTKYHQKILGNLLERAKR